MLIGLLKCDQAPQEIIEKIGDYDISFLNFLQLAEQNIQIKVYQCYQRNFPNVREIEKIDGWIITGSKHSCYEDIPWINDLKDLIRYLDCQKKKIIGICFGHQIIAEALGGRVIENHLGWQISVSHFRPNELGKTIFDDRDEINLLYMHRDMVVDLGPSGLRNLGNNRLCNVHGMIKGNHILTIQGHPEFVPLNIKVLLKKNKSIIPAKIIKEGKKKLDRPTDQVYLAQKICDFIRH